MSFVLEYGSLVLLILLAMLVAFLYRYSTATHSYWKERGVPFFPPVPLFVNVLKTALGIEPLAITQQWGYDYIGEHRFGGIYTFGRPALFLKDPDLVEQVLVKDFSTFYNRGFKPDLDLDPVSAHLLNLEDAKWKNLRNKLTPAFSSGKLKGMHDQLVQVSDLLVQHLTPFARSGEPFEVKNIMTGFSVDLIGSLAFGLSLNSLDDPNSKLKKMGESFFNPNFIEKLGFTLRSYFPWLKHFLKWKETENFFINIVKETVRCREENNIQRNDFLQILMELRKQDMINPKSDDDLKFNEEFITSNAFVFLLAGVDAIAIAITFMLYTLVEHSDIQENVFNEIQKHIKEHGGLSYESVKEMTLLDQSLSETLRLYPPASGTVRVARQPYTLPDSNLELPKGSYVFIPIHSLQHDPKYFPDPEKFDPSRFEDKSKIRRGTYLPFGDGPRMCIGERLARLEIKVAVIKLLLNYKLRVHEKTLRPLKFDAKALFLTPEGGIWLTLEKRV